MRLCVLVAFLFITTGLPGVAGSEDRASTFWDQQAQPSAQPQASAPRFPRTRRKRSYDPEAVPAQAAITPHAFTLHAVAPHAISPPVVTPTFFVSVLGDNLGQPLAQGLQEALSDKPEIAISRKYKESSGLVRDDFYDWVKAAHDLLNGKEKIDMAIMIIGSNDDQALHDSAGSYEIRSDKWREIYVQRVDALAAEFKAKNIPLIWVGIPIMRSDRLSSDMAYLNGLYRDEVSKTGATFVDTWEGFVDDEGQYSDFGPDVTGQRMRLRAADGVHFTRAGARKLAGFLESTIRHAFDNAAPPVDLAAIVKGDADGPNALPPEPTVDVNTLIQRELGQSAPPDGKTPGAAAPPAGNTAATATPAGNTANTAAAPAGNTASAIPPPDVKTLNAAPPANGKSPKAAAPSLEASLPLPEVPHEPVIVQAPAAGPIVPLTTTPLSPGGALASTDHPAPPSLGSDGLALLEHALVEGKPLDAKPGRADDFSWPRP